MLKPLTGCVLVKIVPQTSQNGIELPQRHLSPEEVQERNHHPEPPPPDLCEVMAIGPWPRLKNGMAVLPPFPPGAKVLVREGSGQKLTYDTDQRLKLVRTEDILAVIS